MKTVLPALRDGLVVSCQAQLGDPLHGSHIMAAMALAAVRGGAVGVRVEGPADVAAVRLAVEVPVIGLWKVGRSGVYITPTVDHALTIAAAGAHIVAMDGTSRPRPDGLTFAETVTALRARTGAALLADVSTVDEGIAAAAAGVDAVSTTLSGYTEDSPAQVGPDLKLVSMLAAELDLPVFAEGRIATPAQARAALDAGAHAVVVGAAITRPAWLTAQFAAELG